YYCGLRMSNTKVTRYRLSEEQILNCCENGYEQGIKTFVLQSGEDIYWDKDHNFTNVLKRIKKEFPDCAITLGVGEKTKELYQEWFDNGADRFLLRHETSDSTHYNQLHPKELLLSNRMRCLQDLKDIGYQVGAGMMIGSPYQSHDNLVSDLVFLRDFKPNMVGIGPFIPHKDTPFKNESIGNFELTLYLLSLVRLLLPSALIPATTAMDTSKTDGRMNAILNGCNVIMPNITPLTFRKNYKLYDDMAELRTLNGSTIEELDKKLNMIGYKTIIGRGDYKD
ncbi:MAG: [FeFe] hydrogenase H-cluster radical SAM maturase HydE, partial [Spirochaetaceae bacterium]|nr:[FeFe] hydrogenase H-cluster radical SAM maturase HydE [Spirochaetaceae bacterium]